MEGVLQRCFNIIVKVYLYLEFHNICRLGYLGNLWKCSCWCLTVADGVDGSDRASDNDKEVSDKMSMVRLPSLVHLGKKFVSSNVGVFAKKWGVEGFSRICSEVGAEPNRLTEVLGYFVGKSFKAMMGCFVL